MAQTISRRRRRQRFWVIVAVTVLVLSGVAVEGLARYAPLTPQTNYGYFAVRVRSASGGPVSFSMSPGPHSVQVWHEPTGTFHVDVIMTVDNNGPFPILVNRIATWTPRRLPTQVYMDTFERMGWVGGARMRPFILVGHGNQTVLVRYRESCIASRIGRIDTTQRLLVRYSFLGFVHTQAVLISPVSIKRRRTC